MKLFYFSFLLMLFVCTATAQTFSTSIHPFQYISTKKVTATKGIVVSAQPLASEVGMLIMKQGGNAVDAAIATQLALAVVYPGAGNIGGGGFLVARLHNGKTVALDYREMAPTTAQRDMYLDATGNVVPEKSINGHLASGVPGTIAGLFQCLKYAKLPFKTLIAPAIELAEKGFVISQREAASLNSIQSDLKKYNTAPNAFEKDTPWKAGDTLIQPDLANTLKRIRDSGQAGFYEGETARLIVDEMKRGKGLITYGDLKKYEAKWRTPHQFDYKGYTIVSMPMPSSGGVLIHQMLKMVEDKPLSQWGFLSPQAVQVMVEAERRAYADRAEYMGDADFYNVPVAQLTSDEYLKMRMQDFVPGQAGKSTITKPGLPRESKQTTHLSVIDADGNAVSITTTLNNGYGSKTVVGGAGFFLNDEMDDFSAKPGVPNLYGAVGGEANAIAPGKRMLSSMTPTIVLQKNKPFLVVGTPGGTTIPTSVFQSIIDVIDFNMSTDDVVNKPKFHHQWLPDDVEVESTFPQAVRDSLQKMGYTVKDIGVIGRTEAIKVLPDGRFEGVADHRGDDSAVGY